jgi:phosphatidylethanolamine/phosphatidyl-N-methylethanolamine N-methyltransferase
MPDAALFARRWLRAPGRIGAVVPSSVPLARLITEVIPSPAATVVELGPGTGPFTKEIQARLGPRGRHVAIEYDADFVQLLRSRYPDVDVVHGDVRDLGSIAADHDVHLVDTVVCGLPWVILPEETQTVALQAVADLLAPDGCFATFTYTHAVPLPGARRFRRLLDAHFEEVVTTRIVWANVPPAHVLLARGPRG